MENYSVNYENITLLVNSIEEGIEKLLEVKEKYEDAYLEFDGKRIYAKDIVKEESLEEKMEKVKKITPEEYIEELEKEIEDSDGDYDVFDIASYIERIPDNSIRIPVTIHFIDRLWGVPALTDEIAMNASPEERKMLLKVYKENGISINKQIFEPKIWIVPNNDLEAKTIIEMLQRNGEKYLVTGQAWGASWENLEDEIKSQIESAKKEGMEVYGIELQGDSNGCINVDHHTYGEDDRSNPKSSIEQVAEILEENLTLDEQFVSANDKGYIPAMEKLGAELGINEEDLKEIIANIRMREREIQGITIEQEAQAQDAVEKLGDLTHKRDYISIDLPHSKTATVTDRLYGKYDNLLITSGDGETNFYGTANIIKMLLEKFPNPNPENDPYSRWASGDFEEMGYGFWGGNKNLDQGAVKVEVQKMIDLIMTKQNEEPKKDSKTIDD